MGLQDLRLAATTISVYLAEEPPPLLSDPGGGGGDDGTDSFNLAQTLGLLPAPSPDLTRSPNTEDYRAYRVLGFDKNHLLCTSTKLVALDSSLVSEVDPSTTNCPDLNGISVIRVTRETTLPFVDLNYGDSLLQFLEDENGDLAILDKPSFDAKLEEFWCNDDICQARVSFKGSYKGKSKSGSATFTFNPYQGTVCVGHGTYKNDYIRIKDVETCWHIDQGTICISARVEWRPAPDQIFLEAEACFPLLTGPAKLGAHQSTAQGGYPSEILGACRTSTDNGTFCRDFLTHDQCRSYPNSKWLPYRTCRSSTKTASDCGCSGEARSSS